MTPVRAYAGIGSRQTPEDILALMAATARMLAAQGWTLRSGGAGGADTAFELAVSEAQREIFLPWPSFSGRPGLVISSLPVFAQAEAIAKTHHPASGNPEVWKKIGKLMARNACQVLGRDLTSPSAFVLCWAAKSKRDDTGRVVDVEGGTGLAVRVAATYGVPVYNLALPEHRARIEAKLAAFTLPPAAATTDSARSHGPRL